MTIHEKLAARLHKYAQMRRFYDVEYGDDMCIEDVLNTIADEIVRGDLDDILGVRDPSDHDLRSEFLRVAGAISSASNGGFFVTFDVALHSKGVTDELAFDDFLVTENRAAVYALLRALPDYDEDNKETET